MMNVQRNLPQRKKFKIGDIAEVLDVKKFVIRTWEKEFAMDKNGVGLYTDEDVLLFRKIKDLLVAQKVSIAEAKVTVALLRGEVKACEPVPVAIAAETCESLDAAVNEAVEEVVAAESVSVCEIDAIVERNDEYTGATQKLTLEAIDDLVGVEKTDRDHDDVFPATQSEELTMKESQSMQCTGVNCEKTEQLAIKIEEFKRQLNDIKNMLSD